MRQDDTQARTGCHQINEHDTWITEKKNKPRRAPTRKWRFSG